jgi:hypothetical protein
LTLKKTKLLEEFYAVEFIIIYAREGMVCREFRRLQ